MIYINSVKIYGYNLVLDLYFFFFLKKKMLLHPITHTKIDKKSANTPALQKKCHYVFLDFKL